jgi:hypothetical protein
MRNRAPVLTPDSRHAGQDRPKGTRIYEALNFADNLVASFAQRMRAADLDAG